MTANWQLGVGVTAYLGIAALIMENTTLTAAATITTFESRHSSILRQSQKQVPIAQSFDVPLSLNEVFTLAAPFITSCPQSDPQLPVKAFPSSKMAGNRSTRTSSGAVIVIVTPGFTLIASRRSTLFAAFVTVQGPKSVEVVATKGGFKATVPDGIAGQSYVVLTASKDVVSDDVMAAGPLIVEVSSHRTFVLNKSRDTTRY